MSHDCNSIQQFLTSIAPLDNIELLLVRSEIRTELSIYLIQFLYVMQKPRIFLTFCDTS